MNLIVALQIVRELSAWVDYHEETGFMPKKKYGYTLSETANAVDRVKKRNDFYQKNRRFEEKINVPTDAQVAAVFLCSQLNAEELDEKAVKSFGCANGIYVSVTKHLKDLDRLTIASGGQEQNDRVLMKLSNGNLVYPTAQ